LQIARFVLCKEDALTHVEEAAPVEDTIKKWAAFDVARLNFPEVDEKLLDGFSELFIDVVNLDAGKLQHQVYFNINRVMVQVGQGSFGGITSTAADALLKRLPANGVCNDLIDASVRV
jgi:hemoglobin-like flavoprotein